MSKFLRLFLSILALVMACRGAWAAPLKSPFDVEGRRALIGKALPEAPCPAPPAPQRDIRVTSYYSDPKHSIVDPARKAAHDAAVKPLHEFSSGVTKHADRWIGSRPPQPEAARCALSWLDAWASQGAMLGELTSQGGFERKWTLGGIALGYLKIRDAPGLDTAAKARVETWLSRLGHAVRAQYDRPPGPGISSRANNHLYWAALAVAASAVATDDRAALDWAIDRYRFALDQVTPEGMLPLELARGRRALHYHLFATAPLVVLAEIGTANGANLYAERNGALDRLVARTLSGLKDPSEISRRADAVQEAEKLSGGSLAWLEIWYARKRDPAAVAFLRQYRPTRNSWLGGDMTLSFGVPDLSVP